jgi:hypothetical protein
MRVYLLGPTETVKLLGGSTCLMTIIPRLHLSPKERTNKLFRTASLPSYLFRHLFCLGSWEFAILQLCFAGVIALSLP